MTTEGLPEESTALSSDEAFDVLSDKTRLQIIQALGEAGEPLAFSEVFDRIQYDDYSNFGYHLDKLLGHFVGKSDHGYILRRPGERVVEAILSGAVTTDPVRELTRTDRPCPFCSAPIEVGYEQERVTMHCPECSGLRWQTNSEDGLFTESGNLGYRPLPPAAVDGRTAEEIHDVSKTWTALTVHAMGRGVCPRCSGAVEHFADACECHDASDGICDECGRRFGAVATATCTNCFFEIRPGIAGYLLSHTEVMAFLIEHGIDPVALGGFHPYVAAEETSITHRPFEARYTFTVDDDTLTLTVDATLSVVVASRGEGCEVH